MRWGRVEGMTVHLEATQLPCGRYCGSVYSVPGLVEPVEVQRAALADGWEVADVDGKAVVVCPPCGSRPISSRAGQYLRTKGEG
jgi:hypothetical protein